MDIIDGEAIIINKATNKALILNNTAFLILELLDSYKSNSAITIDDFTKVFICKNNIKNPDFYDIKNDIIITIQTLLNESIIVANDHKE